MAEHMDDFAVHNFTLLSQRVGQLDHKVDQLDQRVERLEGGMNRVERRLDRHEDLLVDVLTTVRSLRRD